MTQAQKEKVESKRITLRELFLNDLPIWVINRSAKFTPNKRPGNIVFQVGSGNYIEVVTIPPGNDPVCISDQVAPTSLKDCHDLFKLTNKEVLEVLDPEKAEEYYRRNEGRRAIVQAKIDRQRDKVKEEETPKPVKEETVEVDPAMIDVCLKLRHEVIRPDQAMERLLEMQDGMTETDLNYVINNGKVPDIKEWAQETLRERHND